LTGLPFTFGELAQKIFDTLPRDKCVDFIRDTYRDDSIKSAESLIRG